MIRTDSAFLINRLVSCDKKVGKNNPKADVQNQEERPPPPQPSILASKYPRLKEIDDKKNRW